MEEFSIALVVACTVWVATIWVGAMIFSDRELSRWDYK